MRHIPLFILLFIFLFSCKKKDAIADLPPKSLPDSAIVITEVLQKEINEFEISYQINPAADEVYTNAMLQWSTSADFKQQKDSMVLGSSISSKLVSTAHLKNLKQATTYYSRLIATYKGKMFFSSVKDWTTDSLKILTVPASANRGEYVFLSTNLQMIAPNVVTDTKVFLNDHECLLQSDEGQIISFMIPTTLPRGKYHVKINRTGIISHAADSVEIVGGSWRLTNSPVFPTNPAAQTSGLFSFGTCFSAQKGWIIGGGLFNGYDLSSVPESNNSGYIYEFNIQQKQWTKRAPTNRLYVEDPICYYYNNSIYVIAGTEILFDPGSGNWQGRKVLNTMKRLDLATLTWHDMGPLPYPNHYFLTSFELNSEWYIGMGLDGDSTINNGGEDLSLPSKKFWKYNPASNKWTPLANFPGSYQDYPTCFSVGSKGYAFYGAIPNGPIADATEFNQELWQYDPAVNTWRQLNLPSVGGPLPGEKYQIVSYNRKAYFLTAQKRIRAYNGYQYMGENTCLEYNPETNAFVKIAMAKEANIMRPVAKENNTFYFQCDALGYIQEVPNKTYSLTIE